MQRYDRFLRRLALASDDSLSLKARGDAATAALRSLFESGQLDPAPQRLRDEITRVAVALATIGSAEDRESIIVAGEYALESARAWLLGQSPSKDPAAVLGGRRFRHTR